MLDDFPVFIEAEKIHGHVPVVSGPGLVGVQGDQVALGDRPD